VSLLLLLLAAADGGEAEPPLDRAIDGGSPEAPSATAPLSQQGYQPATWGELDPGRGFQVAKTDLGDLWISAYAVARYLNQLPANQVYFDHLGRERAVDTRNDVEFHRVLLNFRGFLFLKKFEYVVTVWTVNSANILAVIGALTYRFHKAFNLNVGVDGMPGIRTLLGSHPYWLGHDRTMAEEFARPGFTNALFATGEVLPGLNYKLSLGNNISQLNISAAQLTRDFAVGGSVWWIPTFEHDFGPRGGQGDWEYHQKPAVRLGVSSVRAVEDHYTPLDQPPGSTQIRLADGVPLFETGALVPGVTLQKATYWVLSVDLGFKWRGIYLQGEFHYRHLSDFIGDGAVPIPRIIDRSFYLLGSFFAIRKRLELYGGTSMVFGDEAAGFSTQYEVLAGCNFYPVDSRNLRVTGHFIYVDRSAAGGSFGYYTAGEKGPILSVAASFFF
jgi:hypothetical protein